MQSLNPQTVLLKNTNLIEASAGTGKTYTISLLYLRFVLESEPALSVDQILVVTYTTAATKELKDRIRLRLSEALMAFISEGVSSEYATFCESYDRTESILRLSRALLSFDEASIFTIHSFCQRALKDTAFDAGLAFETELLDNDVDLMQNLLDDYWRKEFQQAPASLLLLLRDKEITPDSLLGDIQHAVGKPYLHRLKPAETSDISETITQLEDSYAIAIKTWRENAEDIEASLRHHKGLYANVVKALGVMFTGMRELALSDALPPSLPPKVEGLASEKIRLKKNFEPPKHEFFILWSDFLALKQTINQDLQQYHDDLRNKVLDYLQQELPLEKRRKGVMSFDDLLLQLQLALQSNPHLSGVLSTKYQVAMIDEFQDTDPIQYDIFQRIYSNEENNPSNTVFYVGDPKQAIYSFRGADIYTYQKASENTQHQYTLGTNWRSHPKLIDALNHLFTLGDNPFFDDSIEYLEVKAGQDEEPSLNTSHSLAPLRLWGIENTEDKTRAGLMTEIAELVADDISVLLIAAESGEASIAEQALEGGDIAVLVRSHSQGQMIKMALTRRGVACVQSAKESIFETNEAAELHTLLLAISQPSKEDQVRRALVSDLFAYKAEDLIHFDDDANAWDDKLHAFQEWHQVWLKQGFIPMMRILMRAESVQIRLLSYSDGERRLTNLLHLSELIHSESRNNSRGIAGTLRWLQQQMLQVSLSSDSVQLRLESDNKLVKIVTVHKSKGLEYGLVYCPYLWADSRSPSKDPAIMFHAEDEAHTPSLDIGSTDRALSIKLLEQESYAENMRLLYVALTRAKYHCTVVTAPQKLKGYIDRSALGWLLSNGEAATSKNFHVNYQQNIETLVAESSATISSEALPEWGEGQGVLHYQATPATTALSVRTFTATIEKDHQVSSFSGLTSGHHAETPDHDNDTVFNAVTEKAEDEFPRGARAGSCLHEMYEHIDFTQNLMIDEDSEIVKSLSKWGFDTSLAETAQSLLERSLQAPLSATDQNLKLAELTHTQRLDEMEFYLPLSLLKVDDLKHILFQHLPTEGWQVVRDAVNKLQFGQVRGYLKGFIDLIFEYQGQYYVADYKSNSLEAYDAPSLLDTMAHSHYYLQYLIYSVALHRYLKGRLDGYSYEAQFGGVYYLFIRGMSQENIGNGIFYDQPSYVLINALDDLFGGDK